MSKLPAPFSLKDQDWTRIKSCIDLPDDARARLEHILQFAKFDATVESALTQPSLLKQDLATTRAKAEALLSDLRKIAGVRSIRVGTENAQANTEYTEVSQFQLLMALISPDEQQENPGKRQKRAKGFVFEPPQRLTAIRTLAEYIETVVSLVTWFKSAEDRIRKAKSGNRTKAAHTLAKSLDALVKDYKKGARNGGLKRGSRASEEFLEVCLEVVDFEQKTEALLRANSRNGKVAAQKK